MLDAATLCLALAVFHESRGEPKKAQYAVAEVIHNRSKSDKYPSNYCDIIKQKGQFSFYKGSQTLKPPKNEKESWENSVQVAKIFSKNKTNYTKGSLFFNHKNLGVRFGKTLKCKIGNHVFF